MKTDTSAINSFSPSREKVALFLRLFRGRSDIYPRRFENLRSGKSGYSPVCGNEWVKGICQKPRIKCSDCAHQHWLEVTEEVIRWHLQGRDPEGRPFIMGIYPMMRDETCFFLAADFDGAAWGRDIAAFRDAARHLGLEPAIERSRSGNGAHAWLFFSEAVPAAMARRLGFSILTKALDARPGIGFSSYDRFFPNQDTLPRGGFGNLIALPLQKTARQHGHTLFLNDALEPLEDQWAYLATVPLVTPDQTRSLVARAERSGRILRVRVCPQDEFTLAPWQAPPSRRSTKFRIPGCLPKTLRCVLSDQIYIPKGDLPPALENRILHLAAFQNPEFYRAQAMRLPTFDKPRIIACAEDLAEHIAIPRGCFDELLAMLEELGIALDLDDQREAGTTLDLQFQGKLRPDQEVAAENLLLHDIGVLAATTAFGKTVLAAWLIARRGVSTLILVHREQLMQQWAERLGQFLDTPGGAIGLLGGGRRKLTGKLDIALIQSLVRKGVVDDRVAGYGHLVVDECHHLPARSFELVARRCKARYVSGLSATVIRKDGHHPIIFMQCGPVRHRVNARTQAENRPFSHQVIVRPTGAHAPDNISEDVRVAFQDICATLISDKRRNAQIITDVAEALHEGRNPLILTERTEHIDLLADLLVPFEVKVIRLQGGMPKKQLHDALGALREIPEGVRRVVLATGRYAGEGFDDPRLDTLFLAMPVSWRGTVAQYVGRLHRLWEGKREVRVYDYVDMNIPMLSRMFERRCTAYEELGYVVLVPGSVLPGWPVEVPLPMDPSWKSDHAASLRRLIRDGVDTPLAQLFVRAAEVAHPGPGHPRSASEAFLFRRLETLPATKGRFRLNAELPIPFDQRGLMEVDFFCSEARIAVEIDGPQHLADEEAWRRDRCKDALLQQNGILILRFLASDLGSRLDHVLDSILTALSNRSGNQS